MTFSKEWYEKHPGFSRGKNNPLYGVRTGKKFEEIYGMEKAKKIKDKMSLTRKGRISPLKGRTWENSIGLEKTKENKEKMGKRMSGKNNPMFGKKRIFSEQWHEKRRKWLIGKKRPEHGKRISGKNNPSWAGGKSFEPYSIEFNGKLKRQIRERDGFRCRQCFRHEEELGYNLIVHHIDFDKKNNNPINLISLCQNCHGQTNFNRHDWKNYFMGLQEKSGLK